MRQVHVVICMCQMGVTVFVDTHSILCNLCIAIVCWRGPVHSDAVACCLSDGHISWWVGFWSGRITNLLHLVLNMSVHANSSLHRFKGNTLLMEV